MLLIKCLIMVIYLSFASSLPSRYWVESKKQKDSITFTEWRTSILRQDLKVSNPTALLIALKFTNTPHCDGTDACIETVKKLCERDISEGYSDIQYNFLIDPLGNIYEGLGWESLEQNKSSLQRSIGFIGHKNTTLTQLQIESAENLFRNGLDQHVLLKTYHFNGMEYLTNLMRIIKVNLQMKMDEVHQDEDSTIFEGLSYTPNFDDIDYES